MHFTSVGETEVLLEKKIFVGKFNTTVSLPLPQFIELMDKPEPPRDKRISRKDVRLRHYVCWTIN